MVIPRDPHAQKSSVIMIEGFCVIEGDNMKNFKTAKDQALLLQSRGINIPVDFDSERFLITRNYYSMINGYGKYFTSSTDVYLNGVTLREIEKCLSSIKLSKKSFSCIY